MLPLLLVARAWLTSWKKLGQIGREVELSLFVLREGRERAQIRHEGLVHCWPRTFGVLIMPVYLLPSGLWDSGSQDCPHIVPVSLKMLKCTPISGKPSLHFPPFGASGFHPS